MYTVISFLCVLLLIVNSFIIPSSFLKHVVPLSFGLFFSIFLFFYFFGDHRQLTSSTSRHSKAVLELNQRYETMKLEYEERVLLVKKEWPMEARASMQLQVDQYHTSQNSNKQLKKEKIILTKDIETATKQNENLLLENNELKINHPMEISKLQKEISEQLIIVKKLEHDCMAAGLQYTTLHSQHEDVNTKYQNAKQKQIKSEGK